MKWIELKSKVRQLLLSRNLANPNIRLNALNNLEDLFKSYFPEVISDPHTLLKYDKNRFKELVSKRKKLNSAESSVINNFYQILENHAPDAGNIRSTISTKTRIKNKKPEIVVSCLEIPNPISGLDPIVNSKTVILILGTFPAKESIDAYFYYQNQIKRFWGQALSYIGVFENISNEERKKLLFEKRIGLWDIFKCVERDGSNQDKAITKAKYNDIDNLLNIHPSIKYLIFNGKNSYVWLNEDIPAIFSRKNLEIKRVQSSSGGNGWFNQGKDWEEYFKTIE